MMVASTIVPVAILIPSPFQVDVHRIQHQTAQIVLFQQVTKMTDGRLVRRRSAPKSTPTNRRNTGDSYKASSAPGSDKSNHCCTK
jgi:hypothetical protein